MRVAGGRVRLRVRQSRNAGTLGLNVTGNLSSLGWARRNDRPSTFRQYGLASPRINRAGRHTPVPVIDPGIYSNNDVMNTEIIPVANVGVVKDVKGPAVPGGFLDFQRSGKQ